MSTPGLDRSQRRHIMITGCAGYLGRALSREIVSKGESIIGLYHQKLPEALDRMMPLCADLRTPETLLAPLRSVDTVVHLAWTGGVLGTESLRGEKATRERLMTSGNVSMTLNLVRAMERQNVRRIIFLSWIGSEDSADQLVLREKYWAENIILNSKIPEKLVLRCGLTIDNEDRASEFAIATQRLSKVPLFTPLPAFTPDLIFTGRRELISRIATLATNPAQYAGPVVEEVASSSPVSSSDAITGFNAKWWGQKKLKLGGLLGRVLFALVDGHFGRLPKSSPRVSDFLILSRLGKTLAQLPERFGTR